MCIFMCICTYLRACSLNVIVETRQETRSSIFSFALQINLVLSIFDIENDESRRLFLLFVHYETRLKISMCNYLFF